MERRVGLAHTRIYCVFFLFLFISLVFFTFIVSCLEDEG